MVGFAKATRTFLVAGLNSISLNAPTTSLKGWISDGRFVANRPVMNETFYFSSIDHAELISAIASDINRMTIATFETVIGIHNPKEVPRSTAWTLIRSYYAAFYAAHSLLRMFGTSISQIDESQAIALRTAINRYGETDTLDPGLYKIQVSDSCAFTLEKLKFKSHEALWYEFSKLIKSLDEQLLTNSNLAGQIERQEVSIFFSKILEIMGTSHCARRYNWLSYMRNQLNYQFTHGVWFPHSDSARYRGTAGDILNTWRRPPDFSSIQKDEILRFAHGCAAIIFLCYDLCHELARRHPQNKSFLGKGPIKLLAKYGTLAIG